MIELNEKAGIYAEENVINVLKEAFAKVYTDGYRDGYKDREEKNAVDLRDNKTEYVDLGLPSGTLWAANYEKENGNTLYLPYIKAAELDLPTEEQWKELSETCKWEFVYDKKNDSIKCICVGPNGKHVVFYSIGYQLAGIQKDSQKIYFWTKSDTEKCLNRAVCLYYFNGHLIKNVYNEFSGKMMALRLVRQSRPAK